MKRHSYILTVILTLTFGTAYSHQDSFTVVEFANVKVGVTTGFDSEEINQALIIGQLAEKLSQQLGYSDPIFLDFHHYYISDCEPVYFISYDRGKIENKLITGVKAEDYLESNAIIVRQVSRKFNVISTLQLLEYSIKNIYSIKTSQKQIEFYQNYLGWKINSIEPTIIKEQLQKKSSYLLDIILNMRIERPDKKIKYGFSYYWQNNKFYLFLRDKKKPDSTLATTDNIFYIKKFGGSSAIIFDTQNSFYYVSQKNRPMISKRQVIGNKNTSQRPFKIVSMDDDKLYIFNSNFGIKSDTRPLLIYLTEKDELIEKVD